jgi:hypothetical protein
LSSSSGGGGIESVVVFLAIIILLVARRTYNNYVGVRVSPARTFGYTIFYFAFGGLFVGLSFLEGVPLYYLAPELVVLAIGAYFSHHLADRRIWFWKNSSGAIYYKGGIVIYLIYLIGLVARLSIELIYIGPSAFTVSTVALSSQAVLATAATDLLLMFGIGLLVGRNIRVYQRYHAIVTGKEQVQERTS